MDTCVPNVRNIHDVHIISDVGVFFKWGILTSPWVSILRWSNFGWFYGCQNFRKLLHAWSYLPIIQLALQLLSSLSLSSQTCQVAPASCCLHDWSQELRELPSWMGPVIILPIQFVRPRASRCLKPPNWTRIASNPVTLWTAPDPLPSQKCGEKSMLRDSFRWPRLRWEHGWCWL